MNHTQKRITILSAEEINEIYACPSFSATQREEFFAVDDTMLKTIYSLDKLETKLYLLLLIGYFRAKAVVPHFTLKEAKHDVDYLCKRYFPDKKPHYGAVPKSTRHTLISKMLTFLEFERFDKQKHHAKLFSRLQDVATISADPDYLFDECLAFFGQFRIALVGYTSLQDLITAALMGERQRTETILTQQMSEATRSQLLRILNTRGELNSISHQKGSAKNFSASEILQELHTHDTIKPFYAELKNLIGKLALSHGNLNYYASLVRHQSLNKLRRFAEPQSLLYLTCYLYFRYRETNDKIFTSFYYLVRKQKEEAKAHAEKIITQELAVVRDKLKDAGNVLYLFVDEAIKDAISFGKVRKEAFKQLSKNDLRTISQHLSERNFDHVYYEWQYLESQHRKIANTLRKLFLALDIECEERYATFKKQIVSARKELGVTGKITDVDLRLILPADKPYLVNDGSINSKRFEFYLYYRIFKQIESQKIYLPESEENKRLEDDLVSQADWQDKTNLIEKTGLSRLATPITTLLAELIQELEQKTAQVAQKINAGANEFVKRQPGSTQLVWSLANKRWKEDVDNPIYSRIQHMGIIDIMDFVHSETQFLDAFQTSGTRKNDIRYHEDDLKACIFGNGANYGLNRIANASDRSLGALRTVNDAVIRPENTKPANQIIADAIATLPIFKHYTINEAAPFGSIDGQKHACRINTFRARFSAKYWRKGKGVSALTLVSNNIPLNSTVISPNEYEGHYAFDLLYNNASDVQPKALSTDTHGVNSVNFAILYFFGYQFAPRYAKFKHIFNDEFDVTFGENISISLKKPINMKLIEQYWDGIQRIICSLSRKTATQSVIVKKLANKKSNDRTLLALQEFDRLIKCLYLLDYVDNRTLRHFVQQALNRGEAYHQLRKAIASINGNQFRGGSDYQIDQWNECARLIANCIIYYNSSILSALLLKFEERQHQPAIDMIINLSPIAWTHIQLAGRYTFNQRQIIIDIKKMLDHISEDVFEEEIARAKSRNKPVMAFREAILESDLESLLESAELD